MYTIKLNKSTGSSGIRVILEVVGSRGGLPIDIFIVDDTGALLVVATAVNLEEFADAEIEAKRKRSNKCEFVVETEAYANEVLTSIYADIQLLVKELEAQKDMTGSVITISASEIRQKS